jgi:hypothetical protein
MSESQNQTNLPIDRNNPIEARRVMERLLPNAEVRHLMLELLAQCVDRSEVKPQAWGITLGSSWIKLNVGFNYLAVEIRNKRVDISLTPGPDVSALSQLPKFDTPFIKDVERVSIPENDISEWLPLLENNIFEFVDKVIGRYPLLLSRTRQAHSPGVLRYLEEELEMTLPDPIYPDALLNIQDRPSEESMGNDAARNVILYGPPGTGKTYSTILRAVSIIENIEPDDLTIEEAKARWDELREEGRIEFVTFHQSYGYEDFVEGIRPVMRQKMASTHIPKTRRLNNVPRYEVFNGVLKKIALRALGVMLETKDTTETETEIKDDSLPEVVLRDEDTSQHSSQIPFDILWQKLQQEINHNPQNSYEGQSPVTRYHLRNSKSSIAAINILARKSHSHTAPKERMNRVFDKYRDTQSAIIAGQVRGVEGESLQQNLACVLYRELKRVERSLSENLETIRNEQNEEEEYDSSSEYATPSIDNAEEYLQNGEDAQYRLNIRNSPRYVLVIDEINRGNISKIFGELITLIEDDKRIGGELPLTVTLPHSRETFGLPSNLYILGTMNTADKSIALVDVALRRRFEFEELMPDFRKEKDTCPGLSDDQRKIITTLNRRIVLRKDRDHQIGHAFFRSVRSEADFNRVFEKKIIPLLQEYFYGDWESLRYVLRENENAPRLIVPIGDENEPGARNRWQWYRDAGIALDSLQNSLKRNYKIGE